MKEYDNWGRIEQRGARVCKFGTQSCIILVSVRHWKTLSVGGSSCITWTDSTSSPLMGINTCHPLSPPAAPGPRPYDAGHQRGTHAADFYVQARPTWDFNYDPLSWPTHVIDGSSGILGYDIFSYSCKYQVFCALVCNYQYQVKILSLRFISSPAKTTPLKQTSSYCNFQFNQRYQLLHPPNPID